MALQASITARNAKLSAWITAMGASPLLRIYSGSQPADCSVAATGVLLAELPLPASPFGTPSGGSVAKAGTWQELSANNSGTAGYFRVFDNAGTNCHLQGTVSTVGAGGDLQLTSTSIVALAAVTVTGFVITEGGV